MTKYVKAGSDADILRVGDKIRLTFSFEYYIFTDRPCVIVNDVKLKESFSGIFRGWVNNYVNAKTLHYGWIRDTNRCMRVPSVCVSVLDSDEVNVIIEPLDKLSNGDEVDLQAKKKISVEITTKLIDNSVAGKAYWRYCINDERVKDIDNAVIVVEDTVSGFNDLVKETCQHFGCSGGYFEFMNLGRDAGDVWLRTMFIERV